MPLVQTEGKMPTLRIEYDTDGYILASDIGAVLKELDATFQRYVRREVRRNNMRLAVINIEIGSLVADLIVITAGTAMAVAQQPGLLTGFLSNIANIVTIAQGLSKVRLPANDRKLIKAMQAPIAKRDARQLNIFISGNDNVVSIDRNVMDMMAAQEEEREQRNLLQSDQKISELEQIAGTPALKWLRGAMGTALRVKGKWYVRLEGEGGVLNPVSNGNEILLEDDRLYAFDGDWEGRSYHIRRAEPI